jgi:hypothetical protein
MIQHLEADVVLRRDKLIRHCDSQHVSVSEMYTSSEELTQY